MNDRIKNAFAQVQAGEELQNKEGFALKGWHSVGPLSLPPYAC